jgi:hypothetical protein
MSGSYQSISVHDGSGTQGLATALPTPAPGVKSYFWNSYDTAKHFVSGCGLTEVTSNQGEMTSTSPSTIVYTFDSDCDAVSDIELLIEATSMKVSRTAAPWIMCLFIERIEITSGTNVISTINSAGLIKSFTDTPNASLFRNGHPAYTAFEAGSEGSEVAASYKTRVKLPIFNTLQNDVDCSYLMGAATQNLQIKVYTHNLTQATYENFVSGSSGTAGDDANAGANPIVSFEPSNVFNFKLFCNKCKMTAAEVAFLKSQSRAKRTNTTQFASPSLNLTPTPPPGGDASRDKHTLDVKTANPITIVCDHFNIYADALHVIAADVTENKFHRGFNVELLLDSNSYSGVLPPEIISVSPKYPRLDAYALTARHQLYYYTIPLSNILKSKDQDYVPLNKFNAIRVILTPLEDFPVEHSFVNTLSVIATGKTTATYFNNSVNFSLY